MWVFLTFLILLLALLAIGLTRLLNRSFSYAWMAASLGALLAWGSIFAWRLEMPVSVFEIAWQPETLFGVSPAWAVDETAWAYSLALAALALAVILTAPAQSTGVSPTAWLATLGLTGLGLLAFLSANPLTLVLVWTGLDLLELLNALRLARRPDLSQRAVISFAMRALGTGFALWAFATNGAPLLSFADISTQSSLFLLLSVGLRLGVLPLHLTYRGEPALRRGMGTALRMATAASSLVLLARLPASLSPEWQVLLQILLSLALLYGAWSWLAAPDELLGRPYWLIGMASLSLLAFVRANPSGSMAWGLALVLNGGLVFLYSARQRLFSLALSLSGLMLLSLPFTLTASAWPGMAAFDWVFWPFLVIGQVLMVSGYVRHLWHASESEIESLPRWAQTAYPLGLFFPVAMIVMLGLWGWSGAFQVGLWVMGLVVSLVVMLGLLVWWRVAQTGASQFPGAPTSSKQSDSGLPQLLENFARLIWSFYHALRRLVDFISGLLEGDGGLLWTVLVLVLLLLWAQQFS
jgi:hypothetical protein